MALTLFGESSSSIDLYTYYSVRGISYRIMAEVPPLLTRKASALTKLSSPSLVLFGMGHVLLWVAYVVCAHNNLSFSGV